MEKTLTPEGYLPRHVDARLDTLLETFGAVEITGSKWCGKTWTGRAHATSVERLDNREAFERVSLAPELALMGSAPHLIDEWQEVPAIWDEVRRAIDDSGSVPGQFILTGSSRPKTVSMEGEARGGVHHSGAGRIKRLRMWPMTLAEQGISSGRVRLHELFEGRFEPSRRETSLEEVARWCCRGGWPANLKRSDEAAAEIAGSYIENTLDVSIPAMELNPSVAEKLLKALAIHLGQATTIQTLRRDASGEGDEAAVATSTVERYLDAFKRMFLIDEVPGWEPPLRAKARVRVKPKRYFADPSLAAPLLRATPQRLLKDTQTLGNLFETLMMRDLNAMAHTLPGFGNGVSYYRDDKGLEVDAIVEVDGNWAGIEIKLSDAKVEEAARSLLRLRDKVLQNPRARNAEPAFLAVVVGRGDLAYRRPDGVYVIPAATLTV